MSKKKVLILCGGRSAEHEVSLVSASNVVKALDPNKYEPWAIAIDRKGHWHRIPKTEDLHAAAKARAYPFPGRGSDTTLVSLEAGPTLVDLQNSKIITTVDVVFPVLHGPYGEDGTIQGWMKSVDVPVVGSGVLGSSAGMDKDVMKRLLLQAGLPVAPYVLLRRGDTMTWSDVSKKLGTPVFVKSANMGSSIGVHKVTSAAEWTAALADSFSYDHKVIVEKFVEGTEVECAVLGNYPDIKASICGEIRPSHDFYSYEAKYLDAEGARLLIPAEIPPQVSEDVRALSLKVFTVLEAQGLARVDFFVSKHGTITVNEINTLPGFTSISMYPKMWEASGISYSELISTLLDLAQEQWKLDRSLRTEINTDR